MGGLVIGEHSSQSVEQRVTAVGDTPVVLKRPVPSQTVELAEVQHLMERLYGDDDRERGLPATVAWLSSLANQLGLSLDEAVGRYVTDPP